MAKIDERFNLSISLSLTSVEDGYLVTMNASSDNEIFLKKVRFEDVDDAKFFYSELTKAMEDIEEVIYYGKD